MGKMEKAMLIFLFLAVCSLLLAMVMLSSTDAEKTSKIYNISILVRSPSERFIKGLDQAALDYNVDVHFVSGYSPDTGAQQIEYLRRELANNADAVVIQSENPAEMQEYLSSLHPNPAVVTIGQPLENARTVHVGADDTKLGEKLGELIAGENPGKECVIIFPKNAKPYHHSRGDGLKRILSENAVSFSELYCDQYGAAQALQKLGDSVIAVVDDSLLPTVCEQAKPGDVLFGIGFSGSMRSHLEDGRLRGLVVYSEYDAGYLSLQEAVLLSDGKPAVNAKLGLYVANADTMYNPPLVHVLFPIG